MSDEAVVAVHEALHHVANLARILPGDPDVEQAAVLLLGVKSRLHREDVEKRGAA